MLTSDSVATSPGPNRDAHPAADGVPAIGGCPIAQECRLTWPTPCGIPAPCGGPCDLHLGPERHALLELGGLARLAVMAVPGNRGGFSEQAQELFAQVRCIVSRQATPLTPTTLMVFLRDATDEAECRRLIGAGFGPAAPVTTMVVQPPCCGAALGVELWAAGGPQVTVKRFGPQVLAVESGDIRWIHCGDIRGAEAADGAHGDSLAAFEQMQRQLALAGVRFDQVVRTWIYVNQITTETGGRQRYQEFNRARADFYRGLRFGSKLRAPWAPETIYPASTGIGTGGGNLAMACLAIDSKRSDVFIMPLENPQQTPAYEYHARYSPQTPKFSRGMAVVQGHFVATLVSGTASIVNSRTCHAGDAARQTEQTLDNIEALIAPENFARHGMPGAGATRRDIAKLRVYVKEPEDYDRCREVVERRLPRVPAIYLRADVCRPELLVEIEAVAFSPFTTRSIPARISGTPTHQTFTPHRKATS